MALPEPYPGLVIRYAYLWHRQHETGAEEGEKDRPCAIILAKETKKGHRVVFVLPVTHSPPTGDTVGLELPVAIGRRLGLDAERSWVVVSETNRFIWPGPDLRPISRDQPGSFVYGDLPPAFFDRIKQAFLSEAMRQRVKQVGRTP